jgi:hypothetical protein
MSRGQMHRFTVSLEKEEFAQIIVDQRGVDVVVRVTAPDGRNLGEFDSPNGSNGPENVTVVALIAGSYSVAVSPLNPDLEASGSFDVRMVARRPATPPELQLGRRSDVLKEKGTALLHAVIQTLPDIRSIPTRVRAELQIARLLRNTDDKMVRQLVADAAAALREYVEKVSQEAPEEYARYNTINQLRQEGIQILGQFDAELALGFLRTTRMPEEYSSRFIGQQNPEIAVEMNLANQIAGKDPNRAIQIAEETLGRGYSSGVTTLISTLQGSNPIFAARLASLAASKLQETNLLTGPDAAGTATNLLRIALSPSPANVRPSSVPPLTRVPLLTTSEFQSLFTKIVNQALAYSVSPDGSAYSSEANSARTLLNTLKSMPAEMNSLAPGKMSAVEEKLQQLQQQASSTNPRDRYYQEVRNAKSVDLALGAIKIAPSDMRDSLYQQLAQKIANDGDIQRGRQILMEGITNPSSRRSALSNLERQAISQAILKGQFDEALRAIAGLSKVERTGMIGSMMYQLERGQKKETVLNFLEQARGLLTTSTRAENQDQMNTLLQIATVFGRQGSSRGFEIIEPLIEQFNEMSTAAVVLSGFVQVFYEDGELLPNGSVIHNTGSQIAITLGQLALIDFDRARQDVDRIHRPEVRLAAYLAIAQQVMNPPDLNGRSRWVD